MSDFVSNSLTFIPLNNTHEQKRKNRTFFYFIYSALSLFRELNYLGGAWCTKQPTSGYRELGTFPFSHKAWIPQKSNYEGLQH